jgi:hypothetical protein
MSKWEIRVGKWTALAVAATAVLVALKWYGMIDWPCYSVLAAGPHERDRDGHGLVLTIFPRRFENQADR